MNNHAEEIRIARAAMLASVLTAVAKSAQVCGCDPGLKPTPHVCERHRLDPLDEASYTIQQAVADFYLLIRKADDNATIMRVWQRVNELENLIAACASAAGRKADEL